MTRRTDGRSLRYLDISPVDQQDVFRKGCIADLKVGDRFRINRSGHPDNWWEATHMPTQRANGEWNVTRIWVVAPYKMMAPVVGVKHYHGGFTNVLRHTTFEKDLQRMEAKRRAIEIAGRAVKNFCYDAKTGAASWV